MLKKATITAVFSIIVALCVGFIAWSSSEVVSIPKIYVTKTELCEAKTEIYSLRDKATDKAMLIERVYTVDTFVTKDEFKKYQGDVKDLLIDIKEENKVTSTRVRDLDIFLRNHFSDKQIANKQK